MELINVFLLLSSIVLSSGRNILSKNISHFSFGTKKFCYMQATIFFAGAFVLMFVSGDILAVSPITLLYALIYGILLLCAQWCYTVALKSGKTGVCSTVYSLGFILPTLSGTLFWNENIKPLNYIGIAMVIPAIFISGMKSDKNETENNKYIVPLAVAMISSGGLGIMQKVQQFSEYPEQKGVFVLSAFLFAGVFSLIFSLFSKSDESELLPKKYIAAAITGICFSSCNLLNTTLAGRLNSAVFFPLLNIGTILMSIVLGLAIYKEKLTKIDFLVILFGAVAIILINIK